jgi:phosphoesterase RecJ-like protein
LINQAIYNNFFDILDTSSNILILCSKPDGDSISGVAAINLLLRKLSKKTTAVSAYPIPDYLDFLTDGGHIKSVDIASLELAQYDLVILIDSVSLDRCTNSQSALFHHKPKIIAIDHHKSENLSQIKNDLEVVSPESESACGVLLDLFRYYEERENISLIDKDIAFLIYAGLVSDTDYFAYANVNQKTFERAALLMSYKFDPSEIILKFRESLGLKAFRFIQRNIVRVNVNEEKKYAYLKIKKDDLLEDENLKVVNEASNFLNRAILKILDGIDFCFILKEVSSTRSSVAMRLHNNGNKHDLSKIAEKFGGGGHKQAAGIMVEKEVDKFEIEFTNYLDRMIKN